MQLKLGLIIIKLLRHAMCPFPENYVPPEVINKLTLNEPAIISDRQKTDSDCVCFVLQWERQPEPVYNKATKSSR